MKSLVETTSNIFLQDPLSGDDIEWNRPSLVRWTSFLDTRTGLGQVRVLASEIPDSFTDADFLKFWIDSDRKQDLAVEAFMSGILLEKEAAREAAADAEAEAARQTPAAAAKPKRSVKKKVE